MLNQMPFTLRQLDVFASLCTTRSFRRSADSLGISQASISNQLKALETQLGFALFERRPGRGPLLTAEGMAFETDLRAFRVAAEVLARHRKRTAEEFLQPARFKVLVGLGLLDNYIRSKLDRFLEANPLVELSFEARPPTDELARDIENGQYDFALIHRRADRTVQPYLRQLAVVRGGIYGHRKFAEGHLLPLTVEQLNLLPFVMPTGNSGPESDMLTYFERFGIRPARVVGQTQYYDVMAAMLHRGIGVASFADPILPPELRDEVIILHPMANWRLLWFRKDAGSDPRCDAVQAFLWSCVLQNPDYPAIDVFAGAGDG